MSQEELVWTMYHCPQPMLPSGSPEPCIPAELGCIQDSPPLEGSEVWLPDAVLPVVLLQASCSMTAQVVSFLLSRKHPSLLEIK